MAGGSLAALLSILPLIHAFNHRHRNQHRASHWWSSFSILRRALQLLADGLLHSSPELSPPQLALRSHLGRRRHPVAARARWLTSHVVPRAYLAFTQLAADNQHAPLGLMLLAVLGRANEVLAILASSIASAEQPSMPAEQQATAQPLSPERGVVVPRPEFRAVDEPATSMPPTTKRHGRSSKAADGDKMVKAGAKSSSYKGKRGRGDELSSLFSSLD